MALILVPWPVALATVPNLWQVYGSVPPGVLALTLLFGLGWGLGGIFWAIRTDLHALAACTRSNCPRRLMRLTSRKTSVGLYSTPPPPRNELMPVPHRLAPTRRG